LVEDPIAKVTFPKYAAGAKLNVEGKTLYFIDDSTLQEFKAMQLAKN
jgi:YHS domain-containing protein